MFFVSLTAIEPPNANVVAPDPPITILLKTPVVDALTSTALAFKMPLSTTALTVVS